MSQTEKAQLFFRRANGLADSIEVPGLKAGWEPHDIDSMGDAALLLMEAGLALHEGEDALLWEAVFCRIFMSLAYWKGSFKVSWMAGERQLTLLGKLPSSPAERAVALARCAASASHFARFESPSQLARDFAFDRAERLLSLAFGQIQRLDKSGEEAFSSSGLPVSQYVVLEASRHWHLSGLDLIAQVAIQKIPEESRELFSSLAGGEDFPQFWVERHISERWRHLIDSAFNAPILIKRQTDASDPCVVANNDGN